MTDHRHAIAISGDRPFAYCDICGDWPTSLLGRGPKVPPTMPSRAFIIRQACLDAAHSESAGVRAQPYLAAAWLRGRTMDGRHLPDDFAKTIRAHFRAWVDQYGGRTCR